VSYELKLRVSLRTAAEAANQFFIFVKYVFFASCGLKPRPRGHASGHFCLKIREKGGLRRPPDSGSAVPISDGRGWRGVWRAGLPASGLPGAAEVGLIWGRCDGGNFGKALMRGLRRTGF